MKKNILKEEDSFHASYQTLKRGSSENILVFLFMAAILLSLNAFPIYRHFLQQNVLPEPTDNISDTYVWLTGLSGIPEGLYQFYPEELEEQFPKIYTLLSSQPPDNMNLFMAAVHLDADRPRMVTLPPVVANIFFQPIPINRADENILTSLPGIGPSLAEKIIMRRNHYGPFRSKEELLQIAGIGPKKFAALVEHITID